MGPAGATNRGGVRDVLLVALTVSTGAVDAISWLVLGKGPDDPGRHERADPEAAQRCQDPRHRRSLGAGRPEREERDVPGHERREDARIWAPVLPLTVSGVVIAVAARSARATGLALPPALRAVVSGGLHPPGTR
jgi:hypothetical protein